MLATLYTPNQDFEGIVQPELALLRGSCFTNLYFPYKYQNTNLPSSKSQRQNILWMIDIYSFLVTDLTLYQDTHPNCEKVLKDLNIAKTELKKLIDFYQTNYGTLTMDALSIKKHFEGPWPWEEVY